MLDTIGSVCFHPLKACLLSVSGSRHWDRDREESDEDEEDESEDEEDGEEEDEEGEGKGKKTRVVSIRPRKALQPVPVGTSVGVWGFEEEGDWSG